MVSQTLRGETRKSPKSEYRKHRLSRASPRRSASPLSHLQVPRSFQTVVRMVNNAKINVCFAVHKPVIARNQNQGCNQYAETGSWTQKISAELFRFHFKGTCVDLVNGIQIYNSSSFSFPFIQGPV